MVKARFSILIAVIPTLAAALPTPREGLEARKSS